MDIQLKDIIVLGIAIWVMFQIPSWTAKVVPAKVGKSPLPASLNFILRIIAAFIFANIGWKGLASSMNNGFSVVKDIGAQAQITAVIAIPEVILAILTIVLSLWLIKVIFDHLKEPQDATNAVIALALILGIFVFNNIVWDLVRDYVVTNLQGAELVINSDPFQTIFNFFAGGAPE